MTHFGGNNGSRTQTQEAVEVTILGQLEGDLIADNPGTDSASLIALAPLGMVRWSQYDETAFLMFSNDNATEEDVLLAGDSYAFAVVEQY